LLSHANLSSCTELILGLEIKSLISAGIFLNSRSKLTTESPSSHAGVFALLVMLLVLNDILEIMFNCDNRHQTVINLWYDLNVKPRRKALNAAS